MTITTANIDIGDLPNDGTGDPLRYAFEKINENFALLAEGQVTGPDGSFQFNDGGVPNGTANFAYVSSNNTVQLGANVAITGSISIGNTSNAVTNLYVGSTGLRIGGVKVTENANIISFPVNVLPTLKASLAVNDVLADGKVAANVSVRAGNTVISDLQEVTSNNDANQVIYTFDSSTFRSGIFNIKSVESSSNNSQYATVAVNKSPDNNGVKYSVYGTVFVNNPVTNYNVDLQYGYVRIMVSPIPNITVTHTLSQISDNIGL